MIVSEEIIRPLLTPAEACALLGISTSTLKRWRHSDKLMRGVHYVQYGPKTFRYDLTWLEKFRQTGGRGTHKLDVANHLDALKKQS